VTYQFITDHLGSVRFVVDVASGVVVQYISYNEFGNILTNTNHGFQPFGYAGGLYDSQTDLVRFGARDYYSVVGRWTAKDPINFIGGLNLFVDVSNAPNIYFDPSGLANWSRISRGAGAITVGVGLYVAVVVVGSATSGAAIAGFGGALLLANAFIGVGVSEIIAGVTDANVKSAYEILTPHDWELIKVSLEIAKDADENTARKKHKNQQRQ
jgi:RHS repeat-associated protein